ncbi:MAG: hypothetical protein CMQ46_11940 [Gammaproteobacteria bacterium]|nr:hypothetical protein [Gammaproteobacteria bacterium]MBJ55958.1 hypothetical protein [Gammaproteobacteria bacterium]HBN15684.1 hypothetical protein [Pseudohongiella sp.]|tara:strand:+ start:586 stop:1110 length:525 start_codon:yes stop_codon:yes gene_type:complete
MKSIGNSLLTLALLVPAVYANPTFDGHTLHIPFIDTKDQAGVYQSIEMQPVDSNLWRLVQVDEGVLHQGLQTVEVLKTDTAPVQVFLIISGMHSSSCDEIGNVASRYDAATSTLVVNLYYQPFGEGACTGVFRPFEHVMALPVFGVLAGEYKVLVNGTYEAPFELLEDNKLDRP